MRVYLAERHTKAQPADWSSGAMSRWCRRSSRRRSIGGGRRLRRRSPVRRSSTTSLFSSAQNCLRYRYCFGSVRDTMKTKSATIRLRSMRSERRKADTPNRGGRKRRDRANLWDPDEIGSSYPGICRGYDLRQEGNSLNCSYVLPIVCEFHPEANPPFLRDGCDSMSTTCRDNSAAPSPSPQPAD